MNLGLLLVPIVIGYGFLINTFITRYWLFKRSGYHLFYCSAFSGLALAFFARIISFHFQAFAPEVQKYWKALIPLELSGTMALSFVIAVFLSAVVNRLVDRISAAKINSTLDGEYIELMIQDNFEQDKLIEITMQSDKVYVGFVQLSVIESIAEADISLIPVASGFRDSDSKKLIFTTYYFEILDQAKLSKFDGITYDDFQVYFSLSEIVSTRVFDFQVYAEFMAQSAEEPKALSTTIHPKQ